MDLGKGDEFEALCTNMQHAYQLQKESTLQIMNS